MTDQVISIPGYTIVRELGRGGMATVYLAEQECLGRRVALKVMQPPTTAGYDFSARFIKEGRIIAQLQHPRIVTIYDLNVADGLLYFSMEYLPDGTLADLICAGISTSRVLEIIRQVAQALAFAHAQGVIHRDIKPQNILIRADGSPVLTDFGIARAVTTDAEATQLTRVGMVIGSPRYMSPEQAMSQPIDHRSDLYSLGVVLYQALSKEVPYKGSDIVTLGVKHCTEPIPALDGDLRRFQPMIERLMAKAPDDRYADADALVEDIRALEAGKKLKRVGRKAKSRQRADVGAPAVSGSAAAGDGGGMRRWLGLGAIAAAVLAIAAGLYLAMPALQRASTLSSGIAGQIEPGRVTDPARAGQPAPARFGHDETGPVEQPGTRQAATAAPAATAPGLIDADEPTVPGQSDGGPLDLDPASAGVPGDADPARSDDPRRDARAARAALLAQAEDCRARFPPGREQDAKDAAACWRPLLDHEQTREAATAAVAAIEVALQARLDAALARADLDAAAFALDALAAFSPERDDLESLRRRLRVIEELPPELVALSPGCFRMGSPEEEAGREPDEQAHRACVDGLDVGRFEVTVDDFRRFVDATGYRTDAERGVGDVAGCWAFDQQGGGGWGYQGWASWREPNKDSPSDGRDPVSCVSWNDALAYTEWLNAETGLGFRLPTEEEWEYAARAGVSDARFWGNDIGEGACRHASVADTGHGWSDGFPCDDRHEWVAPVGSFAANPWGLHDMLGNVWEWTCSEYQQAYGGSQEACAKPSSGEPRVLRGGAWNSGPPVMRAAYRNRSFAQSRYSFVGFRLVLEPPSREGAPEVEVASGRAKADGEQATTESRSEL